MNFICSTCHRWFLYGLTVAVLLLSFISSASEYEVDGKVNQTITPRNGGTLHATASFTVFVRGCGWLIQTVETNETGGVSHREIGSTNGTEIFECEQPLGQIVRNAASSEAATFVKSTAAMWAVMVSNNIPVGETDSAVVGHLWLVFASQCYWPDLNTDQLTPIYDWRASVGAHGESLKASASWDLLSGPGSLPQKVWYLGEWDETNGLYTITGSKSVEGMLFPAGFTFERSQVGPLNPNTFVHEMVVVKRVDVEVTAIRAGCSKASLIPLPTGGATIIDLRFESGIANHPPSYQNPVSSQWPTVSASKELFKAQLAVEAKRLLEQKAAGLRRHYLRILIIWIITCVAIVLPVVVYFIAQKFQKVSNSGNR